MSFLRGDSLTCTNGLTVKHPTVSEIYDDIGIDNWVNLVNAFTAIPYDYMVYLYDNGIIYRDITNYELFLMLFGTINNTKLLNYLFDKNSKQYIVMINKLTGDRAICDEFGQMIIDMSIYFQISNFFKKINMIQKKEKYNFGNEASMKKYIHMQKKKLLKKSNKPKKDEDFLEDIVSSIVWSNESSYTFDTVYDLKIYQLMNGIKRINKSRDVYYKTMGVYNNTVDKNKLKDSDLNWNGKL